MQKSKSSYTEKDILSLNWSEHIRFRPGMYIGKTGDGSSPEDGIYILIKEIIDNAVDEHLMGFGNKIEISLLDRQVEIRDYGRGIPLGKIDDCVAKINTGGKFDSRAFQKTVGLNGVGTKAVNALSSSFRVQSFRGGKTKYSHYQGGQLVRSSKIGPSSDLEGTFVAFEPDSTLFQDYRFIPSILQDLVRNFAFLNRGLSIYLNGTRYHSREGLVDLLKSKTSESDPLYPYIHLEGSDIEVALTHTGNYTEEYFSFVNGQFTTLGGTHLNAFREALVKTIRDFYKKDFDAADIRSGITAAVAVRVQEPVFESQTKTRLGSTHMSPGGSTVRSFVSEAIHTELDNYLHRNAETAKILLQKIVRSGLERKQMAGIKKLAGEKLKKASLHNKKLRDCRYHLNDTRGDSDTRNRSTIFITEGDSASGSITKCRDVDTQAVFSLRGKPLNSFGESKKVVYQNEEFNLLHHCLNLEVGIEGLRYARIVLATDADVDGMHIRLLLLTYFLQFFPELVRNQHLFILETPLFRVRNKAEVRYCYSAAEKGAAIDALGRNAEVTRFKGLGEISPTEFGAFIGKSMRLEPVVIRHGDRIRDLLEFYMGKNTRERQNYIIEKLRATHIPTSPHDHEHS